MILKPEEGNRRVSASKRAVGLECAELARISRRSSTAAPDSSAITALRLVGLLDVLSKYASVALPARALF